MWVFGLPYRLVHKTGPKSDVKVRKSDGIPVNFCSFWTTLSRNDHFRPAGEGVSTNSETGDYPGPHPLVVTFAVFYAALSRFLDLPAACVEDLPGTGR